MTTESIIKKIEKLLRLADPSRGGTKAERESAMKKAGELMAKNGISEFDLNLSEEELKSQPINISKEYANFDWKRHPADTAIHRIVECCFNVKLFYSSHYVRSKRNGTLQPKMRYLVVGTDDDRALAIAVIPIFYNLISKGGYAALREAKEKRQFFETERGFLHTYSDGFANGYINLSEEGKELAERNMTKEESNKYAIVLVNKKEAVQAYIKDNVSYRSVTTRNTYGGSGAYNAGKADGSKASAVSRNAIGN